MGEPKKTYLLSSLNNALKLLDILSVRDNIGLAEISRLAKLDKTSVFKMLYTLEHRGYVVKTADRCYRLGIKFTSYGNLVAERQTMSDMASECLEYLSRTTGETACLGTLNAAGKVIVTNLTENKEAGSIPSRIGFEMDAHCNANGKLLLAHLPEDARAAILADMPLTPHTPFTITDRSQLTQELEDMRVASHVEQSEEFRIGQCDLAAPVFDHHGDCRWALSILCSTYSFRANHDFLATTLVSCANSLSRKMGYAPEL